MNRILALSLMILSLTIKPSSTYASHALAAEISYVCLSSNSYLVTYTFYRDCNGIPVPPTMSIVVTNDCGLTNPPAILASPTVSSPTLVSPVCSTATTTCAGGPSLGVEKWVYVAVVNLPGPCHSWMFSHSENARNASITTITGSGADDLYVAAMVNNESNICNNSPTFEYDPQLILCVGQRNCIPSSVIEQDGDSLTFQLTQPKNGPNPSDTVEYYPGYSYQSPVLSIPPVSIDSIGKICATPTQLDVSILALKINEFRNGILIGQVVRDFQVNVVTCNNLLPDLSGINGGPGYSGDICLGDSLCFYINSFDPDVSNTTYLTWDGSIPGASFITSSGARDTAFFCWTPTAADTSDNPHCFEVTVSDDNCPYIGSVRKSICLTVLPNSPNCSTVSIPSVMDAHKDMNVYPIPATSQIHFDFNIENPQNLGYRLSIYSISGALILDIPVIETQLMLGTDKLCSPGLFQACLRDRNNMLVDRKRIVVVP